MMTFEQWQGQQPVLMVPTERHQPCGAQSRQSGAWEGSCNTWQDFMQVQQPQHSEPEQMVSDEEQNEQQCPSLKASGCKRGGRPVTWIGGGGMDPKKLAGLGVPVLRTLFSQVFGQETASNNAAWLRRKLAEAPDSVHGQRRSPVVRARDQGAAIWNQDHLGDEEQQHLAEIPEEGDMLHQQQMAASVFAAASAQRLSGDGSSLAQQMQLDSVAGAAERRTTPPCSPVAAGLMSCGAAAGHTSPGGNTLGKRGRQSTCKQALPRAPQSACYASGVPIRPDTVSDSSSGRKVLVYWPADHQWWEATLCRVNMSLRQLQLLYADMTEEVVSGRDFDDMLANGHLLDIEDANASDAAVQLPRMVPMDKAQSAPLNSMLAGTSPSAVACQPDTVQDSRAGFRPAFSHGPARHVPDAGVAAVHAAPVRSQSCLLPRGSNAGAATAGDDAPELCAANGVLQGTPGQSASVALAAHDRPSPEAVAAALTHNSSRRSTGDGFRLSGSGSGSGVTVGVGVSGGSGNNSASCDPDAEAGVATKRQCFELSGNTSDAAAETANPAAEGCSMLAATTVTAGNMASAMPQQQQQQQQQPPPPPKLVGDPSQLGLWFANQQLQQLQLQEQVQHNLELQQQAHVQMQQQMAAHMQMRMAGQLMQQQLAATPFTFAGAAMAAAAAAGMFALPGTPTTSNCFDAAAAAAAASGCPIDLPAISAPPNVLVMQQLACSTALGRQLGSPVAATAAFGLPSGAPAPYLPNLAHSQQLQTIQQQQQEVAAVTMQLLEPISPLAAAAAAAAVAAAWPGLAAVAAAADNNQAAAMSAAAAAAAVGSPKVCNSFVGQLPLPQVQVQPQAALQPALPELTAAAGAAGAGMWQVPAADPAGSCTAAAAPPVGKPVKALTVKFEPDYTANQEHACINRRGAAEMGGTSTEQQRMGATRSGTPAMPAVSGATAGCVSGFTGGVQGVEALDEVDTLLSRPEEGLFGALDGCDGCDGGCGGSEVCWSLLGMSAAAADSRDKFGEVGGDSYGDAEGPSASTGSQGVGEFNSGAEGGFQLPALTGNGDQKGWGAEFGRVPSVAKGASHRPNSALAHVFDYA